MFSRLMRTLVTHTVTNEMTSPMKKPASKLTGVTENVRPMMPRRPCEKIPSVTTHDDPADPDALRVRRAPPPRS